MFRDKNKSVIISYIALRRLIGILGLLLPFICVIGGTVFSGLCIEPSISHYYHTNMRDFFVGLLFCVSLFLVTYKGYETIDIIVTSTSGIAGLGIAVFPCFNDFAPSQNVGIFQIDPAVSGKIHLACAALFFFLLAMNSIFLFTLSRPDEKKPKKLIRNRIYIGCGVTILLSLVLLFILLLIMSDEQKTRTKVILIFETIMLITFGISWLVKGKTIFKDDAPAE